MVGLDRVNEATDPSYEDTPAFLQVALFIKESGGAANFLHLCLTGAYTTDNQHPLYPLLLSTFASRDIVFFDEARILSLVIGVCAIIALFYVAKDLYGEHVAFLATGGMALNDTMLQISSHVQCEAALVLFMLLSLYFMMKGLEAEGYWILAGLFGGLSYMTKGTGLLLVSVFVIATFMIVGPKVLRSRHFWAFVVVFFLISSPLIVRNMLVYGELTYEGPNQHVLWLDSWNEIYHPQYGLVRQLPEVVWESTGLPTMKSYLASHSVSEILWRMGSGVRRESLLFLDSVEPHLPIEGTGKLVLVLFGIGMLNEIRTRRIVYPVVFMVAIFFPFAWLSHSVQGVRFISVLTPLVYIYFGIGTMVVFQYLANIVFQRRGIAVVRQGLPISLGLFFLFILGYVLTTQAIHWPETSKPPSRDFAELSTWFNTTVQHNDLVVMNGEGPYWSNFWLVGLKGKIATWETSHPAFDAQGIASLSRALDNKRAGPGRYVIIHKDDIPKLKMLSSHFHYDDRKGLVEVESFHGWKRIYSNLKTPVEFLIYKVDVGGDLPNSEGSLNDSLAQPDPCRA